MVAEPSGPAEIATRLGGINPLRTERELAQRINAFRPELRGTPEACDAARFLLLPDFPLVELTVVRTVRRALVGDMRRVLPAPG